MFWNDEILDDIRCSQKMISHTHIGHKSFREHRIQPDNRPHVRNKFITNKFYWNELSLIRIKCIVWVLHFWKQKNWNYHDFSEFILFKNASSFFPFSSDRILRQFGTNFFSIWLSCFLYFPILIRILIKKFSIFLWPFLPVCPQHANPLYDIKKWSTLKFHCIKIYFFQLFSSTVRYQCVTHPQFFLLLAHLVFLDKLRLPLTSGQILFFKVLYFKVKVSIWPIIDH